MVPTLLFGFEAASSFVECVIYCLDYVPGNNQGNSNLFLWELRAWKIKIFWSLDLLNSFFMSYKLLQFFLVHLVHDMHNTSDHFLSLIKLIFIDIKLAKHSVNDHLKKKKKKTTRRIFLAMYFSTYYSEEFTCFLFRGLFQASVTDRKSVV